MTVTDSAPNLVLVSIDSLRADYAGYVPGSRDIMPTLAKMGRNGLSFDRAIAPGPSTPESLPAIFTGEYPVERVDESIGTLPAHRSRIRRHMQVRDSLPKRLSRWGYSTAAFTPNPFTSRHFGFNKGFDHFQDFMGHQRKGVGIYDRIFRRFLEGNGTASLFRILLNFLQREEVFKPWESFYDEVLAWIQSTTEPYFLWIFLMDTHNPYIAGSEYRSQSRLEQFHANARFWWESHETSFSESVHERLVTAYEDAVRYADGFLERFLGDICRDDTVIMVHGDHGEAFGEHGSYGHEPYLYPENVHVPFVVGGLSERSISAPVSLRMLPEIITDIAAKGSWDGDGRDFAFTRTLQGNCVAIYTRDTQYYPQGAIQSGSVSAREEATFRLLVDQFNAAQHEKRLVEDTVRGLSGK